MKLIITDVTEMHSGNYCVAGWDQQTQRMVRPLQNGQNWTTGLLQQCGIVAGASIDVTPTGQQHLSLFPHQTEDTLIDIAGFQLIHPGPIAWFGADAPPTYGTVHQAFGRHLAYSKIWNGAQQGVHVPENTQIGSLSAVRLPAGALNLFEDSYNGKTSLRAYLDDGHSCYNLPVVAKNLREIYRLNGINAVQQILPLQGNVHVRLGLARAWAGQPGKCSLMINGIHS